MPLIVIVGMPCVGKSTRAREIKAFLENECKKNVLIVSENEVMGTKKMDKNEVFLDFQKEKEIRGIMKSAAMRNLGRDNVVILDAGNYIKGYRYELFCMTKSMKTTQCIIECIATKDESNGWNSSREKNEMYSPEIFEALNLRYEVPDGKNRWDFPLLNVLSNQTLDLKWIKSALFETKPLTPNMSTVTAPISGSGFLYELDRVTQEIVNSILETKKLGCEGTNINVNIYEGCQLESLPNNLTPAQLARYRRQFLNYTKLHPPSKIEETPQMLAKLFVSFLNSSLREVESV